MKSIRDVSLETPRPGTLKRLTEQQVTAFQRDGFLFIPGLFAPAEIDLLQGMIEGEAAIREHAVGVIDSSGAPSNIQIPVGSQEPTSSGPATWLEESAACIVALHSVPRSPPT